MRQSPGTVGGVLLALGLFMGCQPAGRYGTPGPRPTRSEPRPAPPTAKADVSLPSLPADYTWTESTPSAMERSVPILFVHEGSHPAEWDQLKQFWTVTTRAPRPTPSLGMFGCSTPWSAAALLYAESAERVVKIKVPLGLDDPTAHVPLSNPPTLAQWELGKRLFFDTNLLVPTDRISRGRTSCAACHRPTQGFSDKAIVTPYNPPTLINCVYNARQFWDGRAGSLEEVVQRSLEDERETTAVRPRAFHTWGGVVDLLRSSKDYSERFLKAFGTPPTQDAVGKALATYMRTMLSGNALHDRAERGTKQRGGTLEASDYEKLLDPSAIKVLFGADAPDTRGEAAERLLTGYRLFHGKAGCIACHGGRNFTDNGFHNVGQGDSAKTPRPGEEVGRFAALPIGLKDRRMIGAFKTPTLRALPRTLPYFHTGLRDDLFDVVRVHVRPTPNPHLDPEIRERHLEEIEVRALAVFLKALDGDPIAPEVADPNPGIK